MTEKIEKARNRFDIPREMRTAQARRLREIMEPQLETILPPKAAAKLTDATIIFALDEAARIAQEWLRREQLGDRFYAWVDPAKAPTAE